jgi:hypothetical protein
VDLPVFIEERGRDVFVRFPEASDSSAIKALARLKVSIGPRGERSTIVQLADNVIIVGS